MNNKLTISEQFLTLEQAKELQALGIDFSNSSMGFFKGELKFDYFPVGNKSTEHIPTLSVAEMMEMLPKYLNFGTTTTILAFRPYPLGGGWIITYSEGQNSLIRQKIKVDGLLRDALFEMIKLLKQNKFI